MTDKYVAKPEDYGPYDENWCREFYPLSRQMDTLAFDGNRYHEYLVARLAAANNAVWLVRPAEGFVNAEHEKFYSKSWVANSNAGAAFRIGPDSRYASGSVFIEYEPDTRTFFGRVKPGKGIRSAANAIQPFAGWMLDAQNKSRVFFEDWWGSGRAIRFAWKSTVEQVQAIDRKYAFEGKTAEALKKYTALNPGWRPDDGSLPVL